MLGVACGKEGKEQSTPNFQEYKSEEQIKVTFTPVDNKITGGNVTFMPVDS